MGLWSLMRIHTKWIIGTAHTHTHPHTHTHTELIVHKHTQHPKNCRGERSLPCNTTQQHTCGLLTCSVDSSIFHWWERRHRTQGGERNESETTQQAREKKHLSFFRTKTDEWRCQQSHAVDKNKKKNTRGRECDRRDGKIKIKWRQVVWHETKNIVKWSVGCGIL